MLKIGLTGGIASGKTTVSQIFQSFGVKIIDADIIARNLVTPGSDALSSIVESFGKDFLLIDGSLDRAKLKDAIFFCQEKKLQLEDIMHPLIYQQMEVEIATVKGLYCILAIPLLLETERTDFVDRVLVVDCSKEVQLQRVMVREHISRELAMRIINSQTSREQRLKLADDILENSTCTTQLAEQVKRLHNLYTLLATVRTFPA
jgi:dephospho-CoA kinase